MRALWRSGERCVGVVTDSGAVSARATLLATGGAAALWSRTTNPRSAVGDGMAAAFRAGAAVADLEFTQFHPTTLVDSSLLLSEALRGEGATLLDERGERFTDELAPRDVVAREIAARGTALLDLREIDRARFPSLMGSLEEHGYDPAATPIPVAPAAHYTVGGIVTDLDGRTELRGPLRRGRVRRDRRSRGQPACLELAARVPRVRPAGSAGGARGAGAAEAALRSAGDAPALEPVTPALRRRLWEHCGLVRDAAGLERLRASRHLLARLIAESALVREESRGSHFRVDFPSSARTLERARRSPTGLGARSRDMAVATETLRVVYAALAEDVGAGDVTTEGTVDADSVGTAEILVKEPGVVCGLVAAEAVFSALDADVRFDVLADEGTWVDRDTVVARVEGLERAILTGERTALNFLGRLSGIATLTRRYVEAVDGTGVAILDTRKTTPGLRALEKHAVASGGGRNHRLALDDGVLVKDNHLRAIGSIHAAVERLRGRRRSRSRSSATRSPRCPRRSRPAPTRSSSTT